MDTISTNKIDELIVSFLKDLKTYHEIKEYLKKYGKEYEGKGLNKRLNALIEKGIIERNDNAKPRKLYRVRLDTNTITEINGVFFKLATTITLANNFQTIFDEISSTNKLKEITPDQSYTKSCMEFFGLYVLLTLIVSLDIPNRIMNKKLKGSEYYNVRQLWMNNALSLEEGIRRASYMFELMIKEKEMEKKLVLSLKQLYPDTMKLTGNIVKNTVDHLDVVKRLKNTDLTDFLDRLGILTGKTSKETEEYLIKNSQEKILEKIYSENKK